MSRGRMDHKIMLHTPQSHKGSQFPSALMTLMFLCSITFLQVTPDDFIQQTKRHRTDEELFPLTYNLLIMLQLHNQFITLTPQYMVYVLSRSRNKTYRCLCNNEPLAPHPFTQSMVTLGYHPLHTGRGVSKFFVHISENAWGLKSLKGFW